VCRDERTAAEWSSCSVSGSVSTWISVLCSRAISCRYDSSCNIADSRAACCSFSSSLANESSSSRALHSAYTQPIHSQHSTPDRHSRQEHYTVPTHSPYTSQHSTPDRHSRQEHYTAPTHSPYTSQHSTPDRHSRQEHYTAPTHSPYTANTQHPTDTLVIQICSDWTNMLSKISFSVRQKSPILSNTSGLLHRYMLETSRNHVTVQWRKWHPHSAQWQLFWRTTSSIDQWPWMVLFITAP